MQSCGPSHQGWFSFEISPCLCVQQDMPEPNAVAGYNCKTLHKIQKLNKRGNGRQQRIPTRAKKLLKQFLQFSLPNFLQMFSIILCGDWFPLSPTVPWNAARPPEHCGGCKMAAVLSQHSCCFHYAKTQQLTWQGGKTQCVAKWLEFFD